MALLVVPATLVVVVLLWAPMLLLARVSLNRFDPIQLMVEAVTFDNYARAVADPYYRSVMLTTIVVAALCTLVSLVLGFPVAYWLARTRTRFKGLIIIATVLPLLVGNVVRAAGWVALLGTKGAINVGLMSIGVISVPLEMLYTSGAVVVASVAVVLPYMILALSGVIEAIPRDVEEAASNLGAGALTVAFRVLLPLALPGVLAGTVLVFILCMNAYATPVLLGGPSFKMMAPAIYDEFVRANNWPVGASLAFLLLLTSIVLTVVFGRMLARRLERTVAHA